MLSTFEKFEHLLQEVPAKLMQFSETESEEKTRPGKWSKKEIMGHLIDSAANNHQRFVRLQNSDQLPMPQYEQDEWVKVQHYNARSWKDIVDLWLAYNKHLLHIMRHVKSSALENEAILPTAGVQTLKFLMQDYVVHLEHHLKQTGIDV